MFHDLLTSYWHNCQVQNITASTPITTNQFAVSDDQDVGLDRLVEAKLHEIRAVHTAVADTIGINRAGYEIGARIRRTEVEEGVGGALWNQGIVIIVDQVTSCITVEDTGVR